jgi:sulfotransferase
MRKHYFISGLPRSGSTLLCNIMAQNPRFYVSPATSGCHDVLFNIRNQWDRLVEHQAEGVNYAQLNRVLSAAMDAYHNTDKQVVVDKGRGWLSLVEMVEFIKGEPPKIIVPVRDLAEVLGSFEMLWRKSTGKTQWAFESNDYFKAQTVEGRCDIWSGQGQPVGLAYNRVKDAIARGRTDCLLFVEFDELTRNPKSSLDHIYDFLGEERFEHNFDHVEQVTSEDDVNVHRIPGLHSIRTKVEPVPRKAEEVLGPHLAARYYNLELWRNLPGVK